MRQDKVVGAKYAVITPEEAEAEMGDVLTLIHDDGTDICLFENEIGDKFFVKMKNLAMLAEDLPEEKQHRFSVGDKLYTTKKIERYDVSYVIPEGAKVRILRTPNFPSGPYLATYGDGKEVHLTEDYLTSEKPELPFDNPEVKPGDVLVSVTSHLGLRIFRHKEVSHSKHYALSAYYPTMNSFYRDGCTTLTDYRFATVEEIELLEKAEKENGYNPPLINEIGTVIEDGGYYVVTSLLSGQKGIIKVSATTENGFYNENECLVTLGGDYSWYCNFTAINGVYCKSAIPAAEKQITLYKAVVALKKAKEALIE